MCPMAPEICGKWRKTMFEMFGAFGKLAFGKFSH